MVTDRLLVTAMIFILGTAVTPTLIPIHILATPTVHLTGIHMEARKQKISSLARTTSNVMSTRCSTKFE